MESRQSVFGQSFEKLQNKLLSLNELDYPLPRPNYQGSEISAIYMLIGGVFIVKNLNFYQKKYELSIRAA